MNNKAPKQDVTKVGGFCPNNEWDRSYDGTFCCTVCGYESGAPEKHKSRHIPEAKQDDDIPGDFWKWWTGSRHDFRGWQQIDVAVTVWKAARKSEAEETIAHFLAFLAPQFEPLRDELLKKADDFLRRENN